MAAPAAKVDPNKSKPAVNIPVAALKRFANDLERDVPANKFLQLNRERVSDFISKKNGKSGDECTPKRSGRTYKIPGIHDYSDTAESPQGKSMIHLQQLPEFQPSLGPRSRFGEGDGSFFDQWLNSDIAKTKHLFDADGFPLMRFNGQINTGFKKHVNDYKAGTEDARPVYIQTYAERREKRMKREKEEKIAKETAVAQEQAEKEKANEHSHLPSLTRSNTATSMISDVSSHNSDIFRLDALKLPSIDSISLADRDAYFGPNARATFFESYHQLARQRYTIGLGDEEEEMEALLTARSHQLDQFAASGDEYDGEDLGALVSDYHDDNDDDDSYEMGQEIDEHNVVKPHHITFSRQSSRMKGMLETDNEDRASSRGSHRSHASQGSAAQGGSPTLRNGDRPDKDKDRNGVPLYIEEEVASKPSTAASMRSSHSPSRSRSRHNTPGRPKFTRQLTRSMYSRQRSQENQVTEEEKAHLFEHLRKEAFERTDTNRPLSARTKFLMGCVRRGILPQPSLIIRKNLTTTLSIASFGIGNDMAILLAASIANLPLLEGLSVADNNLTDVGLVPIVKALINCANLQTFDLSRNKVDKETAKALLEFISSPGCQLRHLRMSNANVDDTEAAKFVHVIASRRNFKELDLSQNELGSHEFALKCPETAGVALGNLLSDPRCSMETLKLSWNMLRFKSGIALVRSLKVNASLTYLDLSYNRLCDEGGDALGDALHGNRTLRVLKLAHNNITSRPCCTILSGVVSCESLAEVDLSKNPIGEYGARLLLSIEMKYGDRVKVDIRNCHLRVRDPTCWFDPVKPQKEYVLRLNEPYARCICIQLIRLMASTNAEHSVEFFQYMGPDESIYRDLELVLYSAAEAKLAAAEKDGGHLSPREAEAQIEEARNMYRETASRIFHQYDTDNSGGIDRDELATVLVQIGMDGSTAVVNQLMNIYDTDGSGLVEEEEFAAFLLDVKTGTAEAVDEKPGDRYLYIKDDNLKPNSRPTPYFPPDCGTVHIKLHIDKSKEVVHQHISRRSVETMLDASKSSEDRSAIFDYALTVMKLQYAEAQTFYRVMLKELGSALAVLTRLLPRMSTPNDARMLITFVTGNDFEQLHLLRTVIGPLYFIYIGLPNGYYHLNLAESADQQCLKALVELSTSSAVYRKKMGLGDTSQDGNWLGFRNVVYEGKIIHLTNEWLDKVPDKGKLDFDFVYINAISIMDTEISNFRLFRLMQTLGMVHEDKRKRLFDKLQIDKDDGRLVSKGLGYRSTEIKSGMMEQASNYLHKLYTTCATVRAPRQEVPLSEAELYFLKTPGGGSAAATHPSTAPASSKAPLEPSTPLSVAPPTPTAAAAAATFDNKEKTASAAEVAGIVDSHGGFIKDMIDSGTMDAAIIAERLLETLKFALAGRFLTSVQLALLVERFPEGYMPCGDFSTYRVELIISLYTRVVDIINIDYVLKELESTEYAILLFRLGWLNIFNPIKAESRITLDLSRREERQVLRILLILNFAEPGQSWQEPTFRPNRAGALEDDWVLPVQWYTEATLPKTGILTLQYYSGRGCNTYDCAPNAACRHTLMALVLAKSYSSDVWSGSKATMEVVENMVLKMGCKLVFGDEAHHGATA